MIINAYSRAPEIPRTPHLVSHRFPIVCHICPTNLSIYTKRNARHTNTLKYQQSITLFRQLPHLLSIAAACNKQRRTHHFSEHIHYTFDSHLIAPTGDLYIYIPVDDDGMWSWTNAHAWTANNDEGMYMSLGCHIYPFWGVNKLSILFCRVVRWK